MVWVDFTPSAASSGSMKVSKKSTNTAFARHTTARSSPFTRVLKTIGWPLPWRLSSSMRARQSSACSAVSTNGRVTWRNSTPSNCVSRLWPSICAVMPVPSETKNTVRRCGMELKYGLSPPLRNRCQRKDKMYVAWLKDLRMKDLPQVGGKNASLGEMIGGLTQAGIRVPGGFATTADAYREFLQEGDLAGRIARRIAGLPAGDVEALAKCGAEIRGWILAAPVPGKLEQEIRSHYQELANASSPDVSFAVRSSATAEDLPDASFAGQQETFLNIHGVDHVLEAVRHVFASLYNDRAISYRAHHGFD